MEARLLDSADWVEFQSRLRSSGVNYGGGDGSSGAQQWLFCSMVVYSMGCDGGGGSQLLVWLYTGRTMVVFGCERVKGSRWW